MRLKEHASIDLFKKRSLSYRTSVGEWGQGLAGTWLVVSTAAVLGEGDQCQFTDPDGDRYGAVAIEARPARSPGICVVKLLTDGIPLPTVPALTTAGDEIARRMAEKLDAEGCRSGGDDVAGFAMDMRPYVESNPRCFDIVNFKRSNDPHGMIVAHCRIAEGVSVDEARKRMEDIWMDSLRYPDFEEHVIEDGDDGFIFHFLTWAPPALGVTGRMECRIE